MKASLSGGLALLMMGLAACASAPPPLLSVVPNGPPATAFADWDWAASSSGDEPSDGVWTGVFLDRSPNDQAGLASLEAALGRKFAVQMWFADFSQGFPAADAEAAWKAGTVPNITWEPWIWTDKERIHLADINSGQWDQYIADWGKGAAAFGKPVFVRWGHEFNGDWYPWAVSQNGEDAKAYVTAYRRVHDLVTAAGARNVMWVWCPNAASVPVKVWNNPLAAYPGDDVVDWVALDGYDFDGIASFADIFTRLYADVVKTSDKPIFIGETATGRKGAAKAAWVQDMHEALASKFPAIKGLVWFDVNKERDWRLEESEASLKGAAEVFGLPYYLSRPDSVPAVSAAYDHDLPAYRTAAQALTAVARDQVALPRSVVDSSGTLDWTTAASLDVKGANAPWGTLKLSWDKDFLHLRLESRAGAPMRNLQTDDGIWNGDGLEFCLSTNPSADPERGYFEATDWQLGFSPGDGADHGPRSWEWTKLKAPVDGAVVTSKATGQGFVLEASVPWKAFTGFQPAAGMTLGFDAAVDQAGSDGVRAQQWVWNGNTDFYNSPLQWGTLVLKE